MNIVTKRTVNLDGLGSFMLIQVGEGKWCWTTPGFSWMFDEKVPRGQPNVGMLLDGKYDYQLRVSSVEFACAYTMGFSFGFKNGIIEGKMNTAQAVPLAEQAFQQKMEPDPNKPEVKAESGIT